MNWAKCAIGNKYKWTAYTPYGIRRRPVGLVAVVDWPGWLVGGCGLVLLVCWLVWNGPVDWLEVVDWFCRSYPVLPRPVLS